MSNLTKAFGWALIAFGVFAFVRSKHRHVTGLFPSLIGLVIVALGFASENEAQAPAATRAAAGVSLVGVLVPLQGILFPGLFKATAPDGQRHPDRLLAQAGTAFLCGIYLLFALTARFSTKRGD
jgi:hypothetical protein